MVEEKLTPRELEVLRLMPDHNAGEIAQKLGITKHTVYQYQTGIREKFGIVGEGRTRTVLEGAERGLVNLGSMEFLQGPYFETLLAALV